VGNTIIRYTVPVSIIGGGEGVIGENRRPADYIKLSVHIITNVYEFESHSERLVVLCKFYVQLTLSGIADRFV
jgi:hypothetical protein